MDMFGQKTDAEVMASIQLSNTRANVAARLFAALGGQYRTFRGDLWKFTGPRNAELRQRLILAMTGHKIPRAKCGINTVIETLCDGFNVKGVSPSEREELACEALWAEWVRAGLTDFNEPLADAMAREAARANDAPLYQLRSHLSIEELCKGCVEVSPA